MRPRGPRARRGPSPAPHPLPLFSESGGTPSPTTTPAVPLTLASTAMGTECPAAKLSSGTCSGSALGLSPPVVAAAAAAAARAQPTPLAPGAAETEAGEARASRAAAAVPIVTGAGPRRGGRGGGGGRRLRRERRKAATPPRPPDHRTPAPRSVGNRDPILPTPTSSPDTVILTLASAPPFSKTDPSPRLRLRDSECSPTSLTWALKLPKAWEPQPSETLTRSQNPP